MKDVQINKEHDGSSELMQSARRAIQEMPQKDRVEGLKMLSEGLSEREKNELGRSLGIQTPTQKTTDFIWKVTILTFAFVLCGSFIVLAFGVFETVPENSSSLVSGDLMLSIFTAAVGFFAGVFAPSPGKNE